MSEEKKSSARIRFNLLDVALIALAVLCIVSVWQRGNLRKIFEEGGVYHPYTVSFVAEKLPEGVANALTAGTVLYVERDGTRIVFGTLTDTVSISAKGTWSVDVNGSLQCQVLQREDHYYLEGGLQLALNLRLSVETDTAMFELLVTNIEKMD